MLSLYRHVRHIGVREMAKEIGVSTATLNRIERGKGFDMTTFTKLLVWFQGTTETARERNER